MRINKYISSTGFCSRRMAEQYILEGRVKVNGELATIQTVIEEKDIVTIDEQIIKQRIPEVYILFNKPVGITCTTEHHVEGNIIDYINYPERIFPVGRLDKDSTGAILLTNDGDIVNTLLREENGHDKEYEVSVDRKLTDEFLEHIRQGVQIYNPVTNRYVVTKPCKVTKISQRKFKIILTQGYNRQIRRMCSAYRYHVQTLKRVRFMNLTLQGLNEGQWRALTQDEIDYLKQFK